MTGPLTLTPVPKLKFFIPGTTNVASGAKLFTYAAGTQTKQATYSTPTGTPNTNPIILDANGECVCYVDSSLNYDFWFAPSTDTDPPTNAYWTVASVGYSSQLNGLAPLNSPVFTGTPQGPTPATGDNSTNLATTQFVQTTFTGFTTLLAGSPTTTTQPAGDNSTKIASTAYVGNEITRAPQMQVFTSSGTFTVPTGVTRLKYRAWGSGGGGGGTTGSGVAGGGGGGGGGYSEGISTVTPTAVLAVVIGAGGAGSSGAGTGTTGTATSISIIGITANGGTGGQGGSSGSATTAGAGGTASGGQLNLSGGFGTSGYLLGGSGFFGFGGGAFGSPWNGGGGNPGQGGSGGANGTNGGTGGNGLVIFEWLAP